VNTPQYLYRHKYLAIKPSSSTAMLTGYKALLALSDSHTKKLQITIQAALAKKKLKEQQRRKRQEDEEQKQRELEAMLRLRYFEEQSKKKEVEAGKEEERRAQEADLRRREGMRRDALRYGPKKAKAMAISSGSGFQKPVARKRLPHMGVATGPVLTREEKRERRVQAELEQAFHPPSRRAAGTSAQRKPDRYFPVTTFDIVNSDTSPLASNSDSIKERLAAMPNTLTRLNVVKRDIRTVDEIMRDCRKDKVVLDGDRARAFDDWFVSPRARKDKDEGTRALTTRVNATNSSAAVRSTPLPALALVAGPVKKRPRSLAASPLLKRQHLKPTLPKSASSTNESSQSHWPRTLPSSLSDEIWGLFGKTKATYVARDVLSDCEDDVVMEADVGVLEREERISERIARGEEYEAEMEERREEEHKCRRKAAMKRSPLVN
jgi:protein SPT2